MRKRNCVCCGKRIDLIDATVLRGGVLVCDTCARLRRCLVSMMEEETDDALANGLVAKITRAGNSTAGWPSEEAAKVFGLTLDDLVGPEPRPELGIGQIGRIGRIGRIGQVCQEVG